MDGDYLTPPEADHEIFPINAAPTDLEAPDFAEKLVRHAIQLLQAVTETVIRLCFAPITFAWGSPTSQHRPMNMNAPTSAKVLH